MLGAPVFRTALFGPWSGNALWTAARAVPSLDLCFADKKDLICASSGRQLVTFARASSGTYVDSAGVLRTAAVDEPRFDHNPLTGESLGLLVEEQRTNLLLNSGTLSTQSVTVTAVAHTLHFTGTGTVTLSGTSTAGPLVGTGTGEANRVSLTFTPTAGTLTLTVSGTVTNAQLEAGAFRTSYIPAATAAATRNADVASITGTNFSSWYRQDEGTVYVETRAAGVPNIDGSSGGAACFSNGTNTERIRVSVAAVQAIWISGNTTQASLNSGTGFVANVLFRAAAATRANDFAFTINANAVQTSLSGSVPSVSQLNIGSSNPTTGFLNGHIRRLTFWPQALPGQLQAITQP